MNEEVILKMIQPYVKDSAITYDELKKIFYFLSKKEQYKVTDILYRNGINLVDNHSEDIILDVIDGKTDDDFEILYDKSIFEDDNSSKEILKINKQILQSNEILCHLIQNGNEQAKQDLCIKNRCLVIKYAGIYEKKYRNQLDREDLEQVGYMGLIKAAQKFNFAQGTLFSTYAVFWIKQAMSREIMDHGYVVRIPVHMMEKINKVIYMDNSLVNSGMSMSKRILEIADRLLLSEVEVKECLILKNNYLKNVSLNSPVGESEESELGEFIPIDKEMGTEERAEEYFMHEALEEILSSLGQREQDIIRLRYGLQDGRIYTLEELGQMYGVTRERIRQIESKALKKLQNPKYVRKVKDFLE